MSVAATARSRVTEHPALLPAEAAAYFTGMLRRYTDAADVYADLQDGVTDIIVVDVRSPELFAREHIPGAINIPHRTMGPHTTPRSRSNRSSSSTAMASAATARQRAPRTWPVSAIV